MDKITSEIGATRLSGNLMNSVSKVSRGLIPTTVKVVPFIGNAAALYSAHLDWDKMWASYNNCMEHF